VFFQRVFSDAKLEKIPHIKVVLKCLIVEGLLTLKHVSDVKSMWFFDLLIISIIGVRGKKFFALKEKGAGWDPPIPTTNERVPSGIPMWWAHKEKYFIIYKLYYRKEREGGR
jgi:hypothetical protein